MFLQSGTKGSRCVLGTGIDLVNVTRFESWSRSAHRLCRLFTQNELVRYLHEFEDVQSDFETPYVIRRKASYWAARFAAKEAFYKALSNSLVTLDIHGEPFSLLFACRQVEIVKTENGVPILRIRWSAFHKKIGVSLPYLYTHLSLSHEDEYAVANVIIAMK